MAQNEKIEVPMPPTPTVIIYQNADFVSGLLQELYQKGILETIETEGTSSSSSNEEATGTVEGSVGGGLNFGSFLKSEGKAAAKYVKGQVDNDENVVGSRQKFVFSQPFYLDRVRSALRNRYQVRRVESTQDVKSVKAGEFIEFEANFTAHEANAILDILTPELMSEIVRYLGNAQGLEKIDEISEELERIDEEISIDKIASIKAIYKGKAENKAALAAAVTSAIRADFRGDKTKEFYAEVGTDKEPFTAITVCETEHFVSKDPDRLLDGQFTVLAKVITGTREGVPVLAKNKLLHRIELEALEDLLHDLANNDTEKAEKYVDLSFKAKIEGTSIAVLPIAIYV